MGLDFNYSEVCWGYINFGEFRRKLAVEIGVNLDSMEGFGGIIPWKNVKEDAIIDFLDHSDCDGNLTPQQCGAIAPRLVELVADWEDDDRDKVKALELAEDMQWCYANDKTLEFI